MATNAQTLASLIVARATCIARSNVEWAERHTIRIADIMRTAPSGSGIDNGTRLDIDASSDSKLVFTCAFHHMNEVGMYDRWTFHRLTVTPAFTGLAIRIGGENRNEVKEHLHEVYSCWLGEECAP